MKKLLISLILISSLAGCVSTQEYNKVKDELTQSQQNLDAKNKELEGLSIEKDKLKKELEEAEKMNVQIAGEKQNTEFSLEATQKKLILTENKLQEIIEKLNSTENMNVVISDVVNDNVDNNSEYIEIIKAYLKEIQAEIKDVSDKIKKANSDVKKSIN